MSSLRQYRRALTDIWLALPCTAARRLSSRDQLFLTDLYNRGVPISIVTAAFRLAQRRRSNDLPPVRSILYFRSIIDEIIDADPAYIDFLNRLP